MPRSATGCRLHSGAGPPGIIDGHASDQLAPSRTMPSSAKRSTCIERRRRAERINVLKPCALAAGPAAILATSRNGRACISATPTTVGLHHMVYEVVDNASTRRWRAHATDRVDGQDRRRRQRLSRCATMAAASRSTSTRPKASRRRGHLTQLHAGGNSTRTDCPAAGCTASASVVNALSDWLEVVDLAQRQGILARSAMARRVVEHAGRRDAEAARARGALPRPTARPSPWRT